MKRIILTGGGTAGHVTPNIALLPRLKELQYDIHYIGSYHGIEKELIEQFGIPYHGISTGKLRRYLSARNLTDPFRVLKGMSEARKLIKILDPNVIFSKGGFVSVPVVLAGKKRHVPTIIHESDMTPGLANKLSLSAATKVCCNFPETLEYLPAGKAVLTGSPIRQELLTGDKYKAREFLGFISDKPVILIIGGSLTYKGISESLKAIYVDQSWSAFLAMGWDLILSFFAGGVLFALIMTPPTYFLVKLLVLRYRSFKEKRREKRAARLAARKQRGA